MFLRFILAFVVLVIAILFVTEIVLPVVQGRPLFPMFRKKTRDLVNDLAEIGQQEDEFALEVELLARRKELDARQATIISQIQTAIQPETKKEDKQNDNV